jgi:hypothetical protein
MGLSHTKIIPGAIWLLLCAAAAAPAASAGESTNIFDQQIPRTASADDSAAVELGLKFKVQTDRLITGVRFYKSTQNTGTHVGHLFSSSGKQLASVTFRNESASGWQTALFAKPYLAKAGKTYVVSYLAPRGHYAEDDYALSQSIRSADGALATLTSLYVYSKTGGFPRGSYRAANYYVDVVVSASNQTAQEPTVPQQPAPVPTPAPAPTPRPQPPASTPTAPAPGPVATSGGCPVFPAFPDASCTGWEHTGVSLKKVPSQVTSGNGWHWEGAPFNYLKVDGANAVLDGIDLTGCVFVDATVKTLAISRSRLKGDCNYLVRIDSGNNSVAITATDVEFDGSAIQMAGSNFKWLRVKAHGFSGKAAMLGSNSVVEDSYIYGNVCYPPDHQSAIGTNGGASHMVMRHNNVDLTPSDCTSGGISNYDDFGAFHDVLIEQNLINSAGYCLKAGFEDNNALGNSDMRVLNNVFGRKYNPECGTFGPVSNWMPSVSGNIWSGNIWGDGAAANSRHATGSAVQP